MVVGGQAEEGVGPAGLQGEEEAALPPADGRLPQSAHSAGLPAPHRRPIRGRLQLGTPSPGADQRVSFMGGIIGGSV